jgi:hypothetical protein
MGATHSTTSTTTDGDSVNESNDLSLRFIFSETEVAQYKLYRQQSYDEPFSPENMTLVSSGFISENGIFSLLSVVNDLTYIPNNWISPSQFQKNKKVILKRILVLLATIKNYDIPD